MSMPVFSVTACITSTANPSLCIRSSSSVSLPRFLWRGYHQAVSCGGVRVRATSRIRRPTHSVCVWEGAGVLAWSVGAQHIDRFTRSCTRMVQQQQKQQQQCASSSLSLFNSLSEQIEPLLAVTDQVTDQTDSIGPTNSTESTSPIKSQAEAEIQTETEPQPANPKGLACYTCGPTVYGPAHLGHARTYVWLDVLRRLVEYDHMSTVGTTDTPVPAPAPPPPLFVLNITDVDDKILHEAKRRQIPPLQLARHYEALFWKDWDALQCLRPHVVTRVSDHVESDIIPYIQHLVDNNMAYHYHTTESLEETPPSTSATEDAATMDTTTGTAYSGVYFDVRSFEEQMGSRTRYGKLAPSSSATDTYHRTRTLPTKADAAATTTASNENIDATDADAAVDAAVDLCFDSKSSYKRDQRDFALWKRRKSGEELYWDSPWGHGRPGWHIECSAMIHAVAQQFQHTHTFRLHAGGVDLKFPHHTNEIAQAEAHAFKSTSTNSPPTEWIRHWVHTGHLHIDGHKMSKSLKNFVTIQDFLTGRTETDPVVPADSTTEEVATADDWTLQASRADDFRLWCLGLSGSYRGLATYSVERMQESQNVRYKIVRFLLLGEEWVLRCREQAAMSEEHRSKTSSQKWSDEDRDFHATINNAVVKGRRALLRDLDGSTYLEQLVLISDAGRAYMNDRKTPHGVVEPLSFAVQSVRSLLAFVGFSEVTCQAGVIRETNDTGLMTSQSRAVIQELARFRSSVRRAAIADHKDKESKPSENMKLVLKLCDKARDEIFPALGIELIDVGVTAGSRSHDGNQPMPSDWRYCVPRPHLTKTEVVATNSSIRRARAVSWKASPYIPPSLFFKVGPYEGLFAEFNNDGFPLRSTDMAELSLTQTKKLRKVFARHIKQWQQRTKESEKKDKLRKGNRDKKQKADTRAREFQMEMERLTKELASEQCNHPSKGSPKS